MVITYQQVAYIQQCLDGILMQRTEWPIEILIGDDGSTDGTREICKRYAMEHPEKVKLFLRKQSDRNPAHPPGRDNLIALLNAAKGEYIARCDGDDYWTDPEKLQRQVEHLDAHPQYAGCFHLVQAINDQTGAEVWTYGDHAGKLHFTLEDTFSVRAFCHPSGFMYRHSALPQLPDWLGKVISADMSMYALVAKQGDLYCIASVMGMYRLHAGGITASQAHLGSRFHKGRILLWLHVDRHFGYRYSRRVKKLFRYHWRHHLRQHTPLPRLKLLLSIIRSVPGWFLRHPLFTLGRFTEVITGKSRRLNDDLIPYPYIAIATSEQGQWTSNFFDLHRKHLRFVELLLSDVELIGVQLRSRLKRKKIDVILAEYGSTAEAMVAVCKQLDLPLLVFLQSTDAEGGNLQGPISASSVLLEQAQAFIAVGPHAEEQLLTLGAPPERLVRCSSEMDLATLQETLARVAHQHRMANK